jgi:putative ABC transport system substrate-binding protein
MGTTRLRRAPDTEVVASGARASYGLRYDRVGRLSARHVDRVPPGANSGELPVEQLDTLPLTINGKTARALGLTLPPSVLARADEVIQ